MHLAIYCYDIGNFKRQKCAKSEKTSLTNRQVNVYFEKKEFSRTICFAYLKDCNISLINQNQNIKYRVSF